MPGLRLVSPVLGHWADTQLIGKRHLVVDTVFVVIGDVMVDDIAPLGTGFTQWRYQYLISRYKTETFCNQQVLSLLWKDLQR